MTKTANHDRVVSTAPGCVVAARKSYMRSIHHTHPRWRYGCNGLRNPPLKGPATKDSKIKKHTCLSLVRWSKAQKDEAPSNVRATKLTPCCARLLTVASSFGPGVKRAPVLPDQAQSFPASIRNWPIRPTYVPNVSRAHPERGPNSVSFGPCLDESG